MEATLIIEKWNSTCSHCGGNADPNETHHIHGGSKSMRDPDSTLGQQNGCGAKFTQVKYLYGELKEEIFEF